MWCYRFTKPVLAVLGGSILFRDTTKMSYSTVGIFVYFSVKCVSYAICFILIDLSFFIGKHNCAY